MGSHEIDVYTHRLHDGTVGTGTPIHGPALEQSYLASYLAGPLDQRVLPSLLGRGYALVGARGGGCWYGGSLTADISTTLSDHRDLPLVAKSSVNLKEMEIGYSKRAIIRKRSKRGGEARRTRSPTHGPARTWDNGTIIRAAIIMQGKHHIVRISRHRLWSRSVVTN